MPPPSFGCAFVKPKNIEKSRKFQKNTFSASSFFIFSAAAAFSASTRGFQVVSANSLASANESVTMILSKMVPPLTCHKSKPNDANEKNITIFEENFAILELQIFKTIFSINFDDFDVLFNRQKRYCRKRRLNRPLHNPDWGSSDAPI